MGNILYVTDPFDLDGENFQKGDSLTSEQFQKLRLPKNYGNINKVTEISAEVAGRLAMRDATPNKPVHANVAPENATTGHSGASFGIVNREFLDNNGDLKEHDALKQAQEALTAPVAKNEGDTRHSHTDTLMGEHANDSNWIQAAGPTAEERDGGMLGTKAADGPEFEKVKREAAVGNLSSPNIVILPDGGEPVQKIAIVEEPKTDAKSFTDDRANTPTGGPAMGGQA